MKVTILKIHPDDEFYKVRKSLIGQQCKFNLYGIWKDGWMYGEFTAQDAFTDADGVDFSVGEKVVFYKVKVTTEYVAT